MAQLKEQLRTDLNDAMRARDQVRMRTLRMALTSITNEEVAGASARELTDDEVLRVLTREAKKRREAAEAFGSAGRAEQAAAERAEGEVLAGYLPAQLGDEELAALVAAAIAQTGAAGPSGIGQVMKAVTPQVAGQADGARVAAEVRRQLVLFQRRLGITPSNDTIGVSVYTGEPMAAKFVLKRSTNGKYHFNLQAANGEIIATSELYESKASAEKGIESVRVNAPRAALDDRCDQAAPKPRAPRTTRTAAATTAGTAAATTTK